MSSQAQTVTSSPETGVTPNTLLLYRADLIAGKEAAYEQTEAEIVRGYGRAKIPVYWVALQAVTSSPHVLYFGGFDSFAAVEQAGQDVAQGLGTHPELASLQQKLQEYVSGTRTVMALPPRRPRLSLEQDRSRQSALRACLHSSIPAGL